MGQELGGCGSECFTVELELLPRVGEEAPNLPQGVLPPAGCLAAQHVALLRKLPHDDQVHLDPAQVPFAQKREKVCLLLALHLSHKPRGKFLAREAPCEFGGTRMLRPDDLDIEMIGQRV